MRTSPSNNHSMLKPILLVLSATILLLIALNACTPTGMAAAKAQNCVAKDVSTVTNGPVFYVKSTATDVKCKTPTAKMTDYYCDPAKGVTSRKIACDQAHPDSDYVQVPSKTKGAVAICEKYGGVVTLYDIAANPPETGYTYSCSGKKIKAKTASSDEGRAGPRLDKDLAVDIVSFDVKGGPKPDECKPCTAGSCPGGLSCHSGTDFDKTKLCASADRCKDSNGADICNVNAKDLKCKDPATSAMLPLKCECPAGSTCDGLTSKCSAAAPVATKKAKCEACGTNPDDCDTASGLKCTLTTKDGRGSNQCMSSDICTGHCELFDTGCGDGRKVGCPRCPSEQYCDAANSVCSNYLETCDRCDLNVGKCKSYCTPIYPSSSSTEHSSYCTEKSAKDYCSEKGQGYCGEATMCGGVIKCTCPTGQYCSGNYCYNTPPPAAGCKSIGYANSKYATEASARACNPVPEGSCSIGQFSAKCGPIADGCGCTIPCPDASTSACTSPNACIYGTSGSSCQAKSCTPKTADDACSSTINGVKVIWPCGNAPDGCGGTVNCGSCAGNGVCLDGRANPPKCCSPKSMADACASAQYNQATPPTKIGFNGCSGWYICP